MTAPVGLPGLVAGLCDDAAVFPPGLTPLPDAVRTYVERRDDWYAGLVGPLVLADAALGDLAALVPDGTTVPLSVTLPGGAGGLPAVRAAVRTLPVELRSVEVPVADDADRVLETLTREHADVDVYVEIPRDGRGPAVLAAVARHGLRAKFRTGGVRTELHPDDAELASSLAAAVRAGVPFKATAGLHHAVRNTDPDTGFEQHGFLNLLLATAVLLDGADEEDARGVLAERDGGALARRLLALDAGRVAAVRAAFTSFGSCSIAEPLADLVALGVVAAPVPEGTTA